MEVSKFRKICICILAIFLIFSPIISYNYSPHEIIKKEINSSNNTKSLDQEGQNYRLVTSADNVQVPVPKGYVASQIEGENYVSPEYQHTTNTYKFESTPTELTWSSPAGEQYPWTQDENGIWISGNQGIPNSESTIESEEFDYIKGTIVTINYTYSCWTDYLHIDVINLTNNITQRIAEYKSGNTNDSFDYTTSNDTYTIEDWATGRYKIKAIYSKDGSGDLGQDSGYIKISTYFKQNENGTKIVEEDIKTKIHDGGFVIYQLTDAELETDPNGTNVIINDTNKDEAQSERNQYVWVPMTNIDELFRTKTENNGIIQFGQEYKFNNTSIYRQTDTREYFYREPRLAKNIDITKYYLQKYINENKREIYLKNMQEEFVRMLKSIEKYGGYYIGRYETGDKYAHDSSNKYYRNPKIVRYNENINYVTWYDSYIDLQRLAGKTEKYVETEMIYDTLFDYTLIWLNKTDTRSYRELAGDSGGWGRYSNNVITVSSETTGISKTGTIETITYKGEINGDYPTSSNNIFDIAGNADELTMATYNDSNRRARGGSCTSKSNSTASNTFPQRFWEWRF